MLDLPLRRMMAVAAVAAMLDATAVLLSACSDAPILRSRADASVTAPSDLDDPQAAQCEQLRDQIRVDQESLREAPTISTSPQIVAAAQGKADQRIDELRDRLQTLSCPDQSSSDAGERVRATPLLPAPNAPNP